MEGLQTFINGIAGQFGEFLPRLLGAIAILLITLFVARLLKRGILALGARAGIDARLKTEGITQTFADIGYWLVWLISLPILLSTLSLTGLLDPVNNLVGKIFGFLPNLFGAAVVFGVGYLVARIVRQVVTGLLTAAGSEKLAARIGLGASLGKDGLAGLIGTFLFVLILLPVIAGALQPLGMDSVTRPVTGMLETIINLLPKLFAAGVIIVIAAVLGRVVANLISGVLGGFGFDNLMPRLGFGATPKIAGRTPSELIGVVVLAAIMLAAVTQASEVLGFGVLTSTISQIGGVAAQVLGALIVLAIGLWLSNLAASAIKNSTLTNANVLSIVARVAILFFVVPMALRQAGLPTEIVSLGFGSILGALTVAAAIAFGIGGRNAAGRILDNVTKSLGEPKA
jgi:hypothetical protein